jgi:TolB-like protein/DNA-binding winged helix-turn-helix (wHTH) protein/Tfp pilus assembly protein PilF
MTQPQHMAFLIGDFRVVPSLDEIAKDGAITKVEPRTMRLLMCLAERAGQVVSVDQLMAEVWKDVIVSPDSVYHSVASLRRILGDDSKTPKYIANVMRRGYRLVAEVSPAADVTSEVPRQAEAALAHQALSPAVSPTTARLPLPRWGVAAVIFLILAVGLPLGFRHWQSTPTATLVDKSVAVLPFLDLSEKRDEEYFADGMSEELIDVLARVPELHVPARTSSFYFKGRQATLADIAKMLGVANILEGSVRKSGATLRVTAQLIRVETGYHLWSQTFDRPMTDVFKVQDEIAAAVVSSLKLSLLPAERSIAPPTANAAAYTLYLKAKALEQNTDPSELDLGKRYMQEALALDPGFAEAWAALAYLLTDDFESLDSRRSPELCAKAHAAANEAVRLKPALITGHTAVAHILAECDWNWTAAEAEYKRALEIDPVNSEALRTYAYFEWSVQHYEHALDLAEKAVAGDPVNHWGYQVLAFAQGATGRLEEAEASYRKVLELNPTNGHGLLANAILAEGRPQEALKELERDPDDQVHQMNYPLFYDALGRTADADRAIASFIATYGEKDPESAGIFYACRKDVDHAVLWFERMVAIHEIFDEVPPRIACLKNLDHDPRYQAILRKINFPR